MTRPVVVGAGIAGVACALQLRAHGLDPLVIDRGHRIGGRMASRRVDGRPVDLGAAYFTLDEDRDDGFGEVVATWQRAGLAAPWTDTFTVLSPSAAPSSKAGPTRWRAPGALRSLVEHLAEPLRVDRREVERVDLTGLRVDGVPVRAVVLAMPDDQARAVLGTDAADVAARLDRPWEPVLALVASFPRRTWDLDGAFVNDDDVLAFVADDGRRRGDGAPVLVAHSTPAFAAGHLAEPDLAAPAMVASLRRLLSVAEPRSVLVKRWSKARPVGERAAPYLLDPRGLAVCGDGWGERSRIQAAWASGDALGRALGRQLTS